MSKTTGKKPLPGFDVMRKLAKNWTVRDAAKHFTCSIDWLITVSSNGKFKFKYQGTPPAKLVRRLQDEGLTKDQICVEACYDRNVVNQHWAGDENDATDIDWTIVRKEIRALKTTTAKRALGGQRYGPVANR